MEQIKIGCSIVCYKEYKIAENPELKIFLEEKNLKSFVKSFDDNMIFVLGWDWTMIEAIKKHYKKNMPFFWINFWTKGFFLNPKDLIIKWINLSFNEYSLLEIKDTETGTTNIAVNEFDIRSRNWRISSFNVSISWKRNFTLAWDWVIIASPLGSTGYNSSLRWPVLLEDLECFVITPKAPWKPKLFPSIVVKDTEEILIENAGRKNPIYVFWDWVKLAKLKDNENVVYKISKSKYKYRLAILEDYCNIWNNRIFG